jgi:hypothetical protein
MKRSFITRQLGRRPRRLLVIGVIFTLLFGSPVGELIVGHFRGRLHIAEAPLPVLGIFVALALVGVGLVVWSGRSLRRLDWHPDVLALRRYGRPDMLLPEIDAELADPAKVVCIGRALKSFSFVLRPQRRGGGRGHLHAELAGVRQRRGREPRPRDAPRPGRVGVPDGDQLGRGGAGGSPWPGAGRQRLPARPA